MRLTPRVSRKARESSRRLFGAMDRDASDGTTLGSLATGTVGVGGVFKAIGTVEETAGVGWTGTIP